MISCEHGGNLIPDCWQFLFDDVGDAIDSHQGYDPGTLELSQAFAERFRAPLWQTQVTRLLVDCNRSIGHRRLFSKWSRVLCKSDRELVLAEHYFPHRQRVETSVAQRIEATGKVVHLAIHSFTPVWEGLSRGIDVGLLYDPGREWERNVCLRWQAELQKISPAWRVRRNQPYLGKADGLTKHLRKRFENDRYCGIELEVCQAIVLGERKKWLELQHDLMETLARIAA